ncbi:von Willebrand factor type A [Caldithrix abyssi DSM 13497]|uniref:Putative conserved protein YegL, contains vWA domain of TerY type n=1 Tax=Caldithrix abyssi DSM 13497 TaxID=880073 RepID=H1XRG7_CALAY|nr:carboxypeptidase regulatory-like domain-containing protein [Caldithrix abyssi]APF18442.1 putative conserved protein YegL, contains vWA domain of TerY type [Caldithrix abyssi DSM 13497]EHO42448.1 von Willebrand factor type A [Caldithrix abyssi DSM 13497]
MKHPTLFTLFTFLLFFQSVDGGQIKGKVVDTKDKAVSGAVVLIKELGQQTMSDEQGAFYFREVLAGDYTLIAFKEKVGHGKVRVKLAESAVIELKIQLKKSTMKPGDYHYLTTPRKPKKTMKEMPIPKKAESERMYESEAVEMTGAPAGAARAQQSGLKAGFADDNKQFNYFLNFLERFENKAEHYPLPVRERIWLKVQDAQGKPLNNALVEVFENGLLLERGKTYADGSFFVYPLVDGMNGDQFEVNVQFKRTVKTIKIDRNGPRIVPVQLPIARGAYQQIPLDLVFILDTTGSMGEEIERLKNTIEIINANLIQLKPRPDIRFALVLYRDRGDEYVTRFVPFSRSLDYFQSVLNTIEADGGGDYPEDLQSALHTALKQLDWRQDAIRLAYIITDAPPHLDYDQEYTYIDACKEAKQRGIKFFSVGTGGLDINGEYVLRQIAQFTYGKYIFLTYGEKGESEGGRPGSVSHHTGANFQTDKLEAIIIRFTKQELLYQSDQPIAESEPYFEAVKIDDETREATLNKLFDQALDELIDYSTMPIAQKTKLAILPVSSKYPALAATAEYFTEQMILAAQKKKQFELVERKDLQTIAEELKLQLSGLVSEEDAAKVGELIGADLIVIGHLFKTNATYELFLKLERVRTSEILSVTKAKIDVRLGL